MVYRLSVVSLCVIAAALFSWMYRFDTKLELAYGVIFELDRWTGEVTLCTLDDYYGDGLLTAVECSDITPTRR